MSNRKKYLSVIGVVLLLMVVFGLYNCKGKKEEPLKEVPPLRVAWMTSWATAGQVVEALIHTDILKKYEIKVDFKSFLFGPPMNEAALTGNADVTIVGDMPAISLLAKSDNWSVVSRTLYFPYALMIRTDLQAKNIFELKGKTIGVPFGSGPQPTLYRWLNETGLTIGLDVTVINLLPNEMAEAIRTKRVDAIMAWEPAMTLLEKDNSAKVLKNAKGVGFMCISNNFVENYPEVVKKFVSAWKEAIFYTAQHRAETDEWFSKDSRFSLDLLKSIKVVDENLFAKKLEDIDVSLTDENIAKNQMKADFAYKQKLIQKPLNLEKIVRKEFWGIEK